MPRFNSTKSNSEMVRGDECAPKAHITTTSPFVKGSELMRLNLLSRTKQCGTRRTQHSSFKRFVVERHNKTFPRKTPQVSIASHTF